MKWISLLWLVILLPVFGEANELGEVALRFMEKVRAGQVDLEPGADTALAPETGEGKREQIARSLERLAADIGGCRLELGSRRVDGRLAAVMVRSVSGFDLSRMRIFPLAMVRRDDGWQVAPVLASFENTGFRYQSGLRDRVAALQEWMLREHGLEQERLRIELVTRMREEIASIMTAEEWREISPDQIADRFLDACAEQREIQLLALVGGLSSELPADWVQRVSALRSALDGQAQSRVWHLLTSDQVLRANMNQQIADDTVTVLTGLLDLANQGLRRRSLQLEQLELNFSRDADAYWRLQMPEQFFEAMTVEDVEDDELVHRFVENVVDQFAGKPAPDARAVLDTCLSVVSSGDLRTLLRLIPFAMQDADEALESLLGAIQLHAKLLDSNGGSMQVIRSTLHVDGEHAAAHCGFFSLSNPERPLAQQFHFRLLKDGWWWTPVASKLDQTVLSSWLRQQGEDFQENWRDQLLDACPVIEELGSHGPTDSATARKLVKSWLDATRAGKIADALQLCARLKKDDSPQAVLRNLGYEVNGNSLSEPAPEITQVWERGIWTAVSARTQQAGVMAFPLYPVIQTANGPRVLIEVDLFASTKRSRKFLNETALERLDGLVPAHAIDDLRDLLNEYEREVGAAEP